MSFDLEHLRSRNPIEEVVAEKFALKKIRVTLYRRGA